MANELSECLSLMAHPNGQYQLANMLIHLARVLESQNAVGHQINKRIYNDVSIEFSFHGENDFHGHEDSDNYKKMQKIGEGMFFADIGAMIHEAFNNRAGSVTTSLDWEDANMEEYTQYANLEQFFAGATPEQIEQIKRLGEKIKHPSPKSPHSDSTSYGRSHIKLDRDFKTGKFELVTNATYYDGNRYEFYCPWEGPYVTGDLMVWDKIDLGGRSVTDIHPAELEQLIYASYGSLADKSDFRFEAEKGRQLSIEEQIKRGYAPKLTFTEKVKSLADKAKNTVAQVISQPQKDTTNHDLEQSAIADIHASFNVETDEHGNETPESFVTRMDASQAMMEKMLELAKDPNSGITVYEGSMFGDEEGDREYGEFLRAKYNQDKATIQEKENRKLRREAIAQSRAYRAEHGTNIGKMERIAQEKIEMI